MPPSPSSSSSSSSLYIIGASSSLHVDPHARPPDAALDGSDTDDDARGGGALLRSVAERFASSFRTQESLDALCRKYGVPEQFSAILPAGHHRACSSPPPGAVCVYAQALEAGMRLPLHGFFCEALAHFGIAPSQVAPNGWRVMAAFVVLSHFAGVPPSLAVFRHFFSLCAVKLRGWYCFRGKDSAGALFKGSPSFLKVWKEEFFFLRSPTPWPCPVKWGEPSKGSTAESVLTREEKTVAAKLLGVHGKAVDLKTYLSERNLAAAMITGSRPPPPLPPVAPSRTASASSAKGMDPSVYDMMKNLRAAKTAQVSREKVTVKSESGSDTPLSGKKRKLTEDATEQGASRHEPSTPLDHAHGGSLSGTRFPAPPGFSTQKPSSKISSVRNHDPEPWRVPDLPIGGATAGWEAARQVLQSILAPSRERAFSAAKPSDVIQSSYITMLQAVNCVSFSLGYALELEEKLAAREREAEALQRELAQAKAKAGLPEAEKVSAGEAAMKEYLGSTADLLRLPQHARDGYERGMEDMKRAALRRYPQLDPEELVVPPDGGGPR